MGHVYASSGEQRTTRGTSRAKATNHGATISELLANDSLAPVHEMLQGIRYRIHERSTQSTSSESKNPFVTLTYAQALNGTIGVNPGTGADSIPPLRLSGSQSLAMTMALRALHSAIVVGVGTVIADDPSLTVRGQPLADEVQQPRPVILDSTLRTPTWCKLISNGSGVVILTTASGLGGTSGAGGTAAATGKQTRKQALEAAGAKVVTCKGEGHVNWLDALLTLRRDFACTSVMVEGGAQVVSSLLSLPPHQQIVDSFVLTVSPSMQSGLRPEYKTAASMAGVRFANPEFIQLGNDVVFHSTRQMTVEEIATVTLPRSSL